MANEGIELEVYKYDAPKATSPKWILPRRRKPSYLEEVKANGGGSFFISKDDPKYVADPTVLDARNVCKVKIDGNIVGAFLMGGRESTIISAGERRDIGFSVGTEGLKTWFNDAVVMPFGGLTALSGKNRFFNFAAEQGSWYNSSSWVNATQIWGYNAPGGWWTPAPDNWPEAPGAWWIWDRNPYPGYAMPQGYVYFRHEFTIAEAGTYIFCMAVDNQAKFYVDAEEKLDTSSRGFTDTSRVEFKLEAGSHVLAVKAYNGESFAPGGFLGALHKRTPEVSPNATTVVSVTSASTWKVMGYPASEPAWTVGEILLKLLNEAQTAGVLFPTWLTTDFTATADSYGNAWPEKLEWSFKVGESYASVLSRFEDIYDIWIEVSATTYKLRIAPTRGVSHDVGTSNPIRFFAGKHLQNATTKTDGSIKNSLAIDTSEGWVSASNSASVAKYGKLQGALSTEADQDFANKLASSVFARKAEEEVGATYKLTVTNKLPWVDFNVGDWVLAPNEQGLATLRRVMSISVEETDQGKVDYTIEFDTIFRENEDQLNRSLNKLTGGGVGGGLSNASGISGGGGGTGSVEMPPSNSVIQKVPNPPTSVVADSTGYWSANGVNALSKVTVSWSPTTLNTDGTATVPVRYDVYAKNTATANAALELFGSTSGTTLDLTNFVPGTTWAFQVVAVNGNGQQSNLSAATSEVMDGPNTPMAAPNTPSLSSNLGLLNVGWNGLLNGNAPPPQFRYVYAKVATSSGGTYTRMGPTLARDGRNIQIAGLTVGSTYWVKLVAVDGAGVESADSASASQTITGVNLGDIDASVGQAIDAANEAAKDATEQLNLLVDSSFEDATSANWTLSTGTTNVTTAPRTGSRHLRIAAGSVVREAFRYARVLTCDPNDVYYFRIYIRSESASPPIDALELSIMYGATDTTVTNTAVVKLSGTIVQGAYTVVSGTWLVPSTAFFFKPRMRTLDIGNTKSYFVDDIRLYRMTDSELLVNGSVVSDKIAADAVVANKIAANAIDASKIQANAITSDKIVAGAVTTNQLAAGAVEANNIKAGAVQTNHLAPALGSEINIAGNVTITSMNTDINTVENDLAATSDNLESMQTFYQFGATGAIIGSPGSVFSTAIRSDRIEMLENGNVISYWNSGQFNVAQLIAERLTMGNHQIERFGNDTIIRDL